jgi:uncharacterized damage-inducible protein DinB
MKCEGLDDEQAAVASVPPSGFTLTGLVQHMAEVERNWFGRVLAGEQAPPIYDPQADLRGHAPLSADHQILAGHANFPDQHESVEFGPWLSGVAVARGTGCGSVRSSPCAAR